MNIKQYHDQIVDVIAKAGQLVLAFWRTTNHGRFKKDGSIVTDADLGSQQFIIENLKKIIPHAGFVAEELDEREHVSAPYVWIIDPLDGTSMFAYGLDYFSISIAFEYNKSVIAGWIYRPITQELWYAYDKQGAWYGDQQLHMQPIENSEMSMISISFPSRRDDKINAIIDRLTPLLKKIRHIRSLGSVALDGAHTAMGRLDGALFFGLHRWDIAAAQIIIEQAGGAIQEVSIQGQAVSIMSHKALIEALIGHLLK